MNAATLPLPVAPAFQSSRPLCCGVPAAGFLNAREWPCLGLVIAECKACGSTRTIGEVDEGVFNICPNAECLSDLDAGERHSRECRDHGEDEGSDTDRWIDERGL